MESYLILIAFWFLSLFSPGKQGTARQPVSPVPVAVQNKSTPVIPVAPVKAAEPSVPQELIIPAINLDTKILSVDLDDQNLVTVPPADVGWYVRSAKPGETGNAVLQGHVRNFDLTPGIFNRLAELQTGDDIYTLDSGGTKTHFKVVANDLMEASAFPVEKIYGPSGNANLNLITCAGTYDPQKNDYRERTVIYAQRVIP